ncbi:SDR family NAD(P)-dependent oxidoreductase [uncultured Roseibium sp.]|uniref:SDR family oxidoreductase n=1 Tax=uncultured Roseibium sp. TaxID=1936171 RepID=UPI003217DB82
MAQRLNFNGRKVLVTGGARGIGLELSRQLIGQRASVLAVGSNKAHLDRLAIAFPGKVHTFTADLGEPRGATAVAEWVQDQHPDCSVVINNAAIMRHDDLTVGTEGQEEMIAHEIAINLVAPLQLCTALLPMLAKAPDGGVIANISSGLAIAPKRDAAVYCATKAGLSSFTRSLRDQCRHKGLPVQVTDVIMTLVDTTLSRAGSMKKYPPAQAAADVLTGLAAGKPEVWVEKTKLLRLIFRISPAAAYGLMRGQ